MATGNPGSSSDDSHLAGHGDGYTLPQTLAVLGIAWNADQSTPSAAPSTQSTSSAAVDTLQTETPLPAPTGNEPRSATTVVAPLEPPLPPPARVTAAPAAVVTLLTIQEARNLRAQTRIAGTGKKTMRKLLDHVSDYWPETPDQLIHPIPHNVPWQHYIARHAECDRIIGSGIVRAYLEFLQHVRDPNRNNQLRLDFVFENLDGQRCQLHPGGKGKDAKPIYTTIAIPPDSDG